MKNKIIIEDYWKAVNNRDWDTFEKLVSDDIIYTLPQTRERVTGLMAFRELNETYPGNWTLSLTDLIVDDYQAVSKISFINDNEEETGISFFEIYNSKIVRITEYWPVPYDPPKRNCKHIEKY